jgi:hypothetical protein
MNPPASDPLSISLATSEPTWPQALRVWWSFQWRVTLISLLLAWFIDFWIGMLGGIVGMRARGLAAATTTVAIVVNALVGLYIMKDVIDRDFGKFRVCLVPSLTPPEAVSPQTSRGQPQP